MNALVVDSGAVTELLLRGGAAGVHRNSLVAGQDLVAPHLIDPELLSSARKLLLRGDVPAERGDQLLREFKRTTIERFPHAALFDRAWELRENITPYDAMYVALAQTLGIPLVTADRRLAIAAARHCDVVVLE